jgi:hypothetical protein
LVSPAKVAERVWGPVVEKVVVTVAVAVLPE